MPILSRPKAVTTILCSALLAAGSALFSSGASAYGGMMGYGPYDQEEVAPMMGYYGRGMPYGGWQRPGPMMGPDMEMMGPGYGLRALSLTEEQWDKINQIQQEWRKEHFKRMGSMHAAMGNLQAAMAAPEPDAEAVAKAHEELSALQREMLKSRIELRSQMRSVLTEEQRKQLRPRMGPMMW